MSGLSERGWISGGYALVKEMATPDALRAGLLGDRIISASSTIVDMLSLHEMWRESARTPQERIAAVLEQIGLETPVPAELADWAQRQVVPEGGPSYEYFVDIEGLREFWRLVHSEGTDEFRLIGVATLRDEAPMFLADVGQQAGYDIADIVKLNRAPEPGGTLLGYEPLGAQPAGMYSWLTCYFHRIAAAELGIRPNSCGLLSSLDEASRVCELMNRDDGRADDAVWSPWAVLEYPLVQDSTSPTVRSEVPGSVD